jgi:hypothetical protein
MTATDLSLFQCIQRLKYPIIACEHAGVVEFHAVRVKQPLSVRAIEEARRIALNVAKLPELAEAG